MSIQVGSIVTVINEDLRFFESQGEVVEIKNDGNPDGNIGVKFGPGCENLFDYPEDENTVIRFVEGELRQDEDWLMEVKVIRLYGRHCWHTLRMLKEPFDPTKECPADGCGKKVSRRCLVNIWGTVCEVDLCEKHVEEYHGKCGETFPAKKVACAPG